MRLLDHFPRWFSWIGKNRVDAAADYQGVTCCTWIRVNIANPDKLFLKTHFPGA